MEGSNMAMPIPFKGGEEHDALQRKNRRLYSYLRRPGVLHDIKRGYRRRARCFLKREARVLVDQTAQEILEEMERRREEEGAAQEWDWSAYFGSDMEMAG